MTTIRMDDEIFNLHEAAQFLKKSPRIVRKLIKDKRLHASKSGCNGGGQFEIQTTLWELVL